VPGYTARFAVGTQVSVVPEARLQEFRRTWRYHHALQDVQMPYAGARARVATVGFYHGGDVLYTLDNVPGIWHEACLDSAGASNAV
jgi:hypothetical protein